MVTVTEQVVADIAEPGDVDELVITSSGSASRAR